MLFKLIISCCGLNAITKTGVIVFRNQYVEFVVDGSIINKNICYVDTIDISKTLFQSERRLAERLGIKRDVRHRALADVKATAFFLLLLLIVV